MRRFSPSIFNRATMLGFLASAALLGNACGSKTTDAPKPQPQAQTAPAEKPPEAPPAPAAQDPRKETDPVLVTIGKEELKASQLAIVFEEFKTRKLTPKQLDVLLETHIAQRLMAQLAKAENFNPGFEYKLEDPSQVSDAFLAARFGEAAKANITEADLAAYFSERRAFRIATTRADEMFQPLLENLKDIKAPEERMEIFKNHLTRLSPRRAQVEVVEVYRNGLTLTGEQALPSDAAEALFALAAPGDISEPRRIERGRSILQLIEIKPAQPLTEVTPEALTAANAKILKDKIDELAAPFIKEQFAKSDVTFHREALRHYAVRLMPARPLRGHSLRRPGAGEMAPGESKDPRRLIGRPNKELMLERVQKNPPTPPVEKAPSEVSQ